MFEIPIVQEPEIVHNKRSGIMLCYPFEEKRLLTWQPPYIIQPKLDGVRCRGLIKNGQSTLVSSENHLITLVPHINKALEESLGDLEIETDGELYAHGLSFQEIFGITSRSKNIHPDALKIKYHLFDLVGLTPQIQRLSLLQTLEKECIRSEHIKVVPSFLVSTMPEIMDYYEKFIDAGYEGFILREANKQYERKRFTGIMKFKPHQKDEYTIIGHEEEFSQYGYPKSSLGAFVCAGSDGTPFNVGSGFTAQQRKEFWQQRGEMVGKKIRVKYQALTQGRGVPRFPVFVEVI